MQSATTGTSAAIFKQIGLVPPASTRVEFALMTPGMDDSAQLLLVMPEADWALLRAQILQKTTRELFVSEDENFMLGVDEKGWKPSTIAGLKTGQVPWGDGSEALNVGIAPPRAGKVRLFLVWHQT